MRFLQKQKNIKSLFVLYPLIFIAGCSFLKPPIRESIKLETVEDYSFLNQSLSNRTKSLQTLKGIVHINLKTQQNRKSFSTAIVLKTPNLLRFEVLNPLRQPLAVITSDGKNMYQTNIKDSLIFVTPLTKSALEKLLGIPFMPEELIEMITGNIPIERFNQERAQFDKDNNLYILQVSDKMRNLIKKYWVDYSRLIPLKIEALDSNGSALYEVSYSGYKEINNYFMPQEITCNYFVKNISVKINFKESSINSEVSQDLFSFQKNSGFKIIYSE